MSLSFTAKLSLTVGGAALAAAAALTQLHTVHYGDLDPAIASIDRELHALDQVTPDAAEVATAQLAKLQRDLWTSASFDAWRSALPAGWTLASVGAPEVKRLALQRVAFSRPQALKSDWPEIVRLVSELQAKPAFVIRALTLTASAQRSRSFATVLIVGNAAFPAQP